MKPQTCTVAFSGATGLNFVAGEKCLHCVFLAKHVVFFVDLFANMLAQLSLCCPLAPFCLFLMPLKNLKLLKIRPQFRSAGILSSSPVVLKKTSDGSIQVSDDGTGHRFHSFYWQVYQVPLANTNLKQKIQK